VEERMSASTIRLLEAASPLSANPGHSGRLAEDPAWVKTGG
jgi:hypothetical protein